MYNFIYNIIDELPSLPYLPNIDEVQNFIVNLVDTVSYFLPMRQFMLIFGLYIGIIHWNFFYKIATKVWESLPFVQ